MSALTDTSLLVMTASDSTGAIDPGCVLTWREFIDANQEDAPEDVEAVRQGLSESGVAQVGGGAAPLFTIRLFDAANKLSPSLTIERPIA